MQARVQVISERNESYTGKRGKVEQTIVACLDLDRTHPFINTFDYVLNEDELKQHGSKLVGKTVSLGIITFEPAFGGRLRAKGQIVNVGPDQRELL
jgi:hypothetical protein